jgi:hypothetical protein
LSELIIVHRYDLSYCPLAQMASWLYVDILALPVVCSMYHFSLGWFEDLFRDAIGMQAQSTASAGGKPQSRGRNLKGKAPQPPLQAKRQTLSPPQQQRRVAASSVIQLQQQHSIGDSVLAEAQVGNNLQVNHTSLLNHLFD